MASIRDIAEKFFVACDEGKGWEVCKAYCTPDATFSVQAEPLADIHTLQQYTDWMQGLFAIIPDGRYELKALGTPERLRLRRLFGYAYGRGRSVPTNSQKHEYRLCVCDGI